MRRLRSAWLLLLFSACAHESRPPSGPDSGYTLRAPSRASPRYPAAAASPSDQEAGGALATQFQAAPALATLQGEASYYSDGLAGHPTASGEPYRPLAFTAAHRKLPLGTVLRVMRSDGTHVVYVRVNDRGPYGGKGRILDLSRAAAEQLGMLRAGVLQVRAEVVDYGHKKGR